MDSTDPGSDAGSLSGAQHLRLLGLSLVQATEGTRGGTRVNQALRERAAGETEPPGFTVVSVAGESVCEQTWVRSSERAGRPGCPAGCCVGRCGRAGPMSLHMGPQQGYEGAPGSAPRTPQPFSVEDRAEVPLGCIRTPHPK